MPLLRLLRFFSPPLKMRDPLRPNGQKILKPKHLAKKRNSTKNTHTYIRKTLGRGTLNSCARNSGAISHKRRGHGTLNLVFTLEPACILDRRGPKQPIRHKLCHGWVVVHIEFHHPWDLNRRRWTDSSVAEEFFHGIVFSLWCLVPQQEEKGLSGAIVNAKTRGAKANVCIVDVSSSCRLSRW